MIKRKLLIFIDWYYPAFKAGGPIKSVFNIAQTLKEDLEISIITSAYDLGEVNSLEGVPTDTWMTNEEIKVIYLKREQQSRSRLKELILEVSPDIIYFNSLFSTAFTLKPIIIAKRLGINGVIVAPRGMLGKAALEIKPLKKRVFLSIARAMGIFANVQWHASTEQERKEIEMVFGQGATISIAKNIAGRALRRELPSRFKVPGELKLVFFSRINEKKNLLFALEVLREWDGGAIYLDIYGPIEDKNYWEKCLQLMKNSSVHFDYKGLIHPTQLDAILHHYHYLFFPTKHENYGHVIAESLCASLPVIISQNTPWRNLAAQNLGADLPLLIEDFQAYISKVVKEGESEYQVKVEAAYAYSLQNIVHVDVIDENRNLFL